MPTGVGDMDESVAGETLDRDHAIETRSHRIGECVDVGRGEDISTSCRRTVRLKPFIGTNKKDTNVSTSDNGMVNGTMGESFSAFAPFSVNPVGAA